MFSFILLRFLRFFYVFYSTDDQNCNHTAVHQHLSNVAHASTETPSNVQLTALGPQLGDWTFSRAYYVFNLDPVSFESPRFSSGSCWYSSRSFIVAATNSSTSASSGVPT